MIEIFLDIESTGINPYYSEVIEAYFEVYINGQQVDDYYLKAKIDNWSYEAEEIHKISQMQANMYPDKKEAYRGLLTWLSKYKGFRFVTYAKKNTELGYLNFDVAILTNELNLLGTPNYYLENKLNMKPNRSVHTKAKEAYNKNLFTPIKNKGRISFKQELVYKALFNESYKAHNCVEDVKALIRIDNELERLMNEDPFFI